MKIYIVLKPFGVYRAGTKIQLNDAEADRLMHKELVKEYSANKKAETFGKK